MAENVMLLDMPLRMNECGPDGKLRSHLWFDYLQHIAAIHAEKLGFGMTAIKEKNLIWVLSRIKVVMNDSPMYDDVIRLESYHNGYEKLFAKRQFIVRSAKTGKEFGYASSFWLTLQLPSLRPCPPAKLLDMDPEDNLEKTEFFSMLDKLVPEGETGTEMLHHVNCSHIDLNEHLNNTYYSEYALDWISEKLGKLIRFQEIQVNYNRAMMLGEDLIVSGAILPDNRFYVEGTDRASGKNSFQASGIYAELN